MIESRSVKPYAIISLKQKIVTNFLPVTSHLFYHIQDTNIESKIFLQSKLTSSKFGNAAEFDINMD